MEKELWDAFYGKESKQERCAVLTEADLNRHNKNILNEGFMSDEDIHNQFSKFEVLDFSKEGEHSGYIELSFPNADEVDYDSSVITGYTIYEDGKVAFDNWFPDDVYNELAEYVKQHHSEELDEGCGRKKAKKKLKESTEPVYISVDVVPHSGIVILKSDEFGKVRYLPNDFEKQNDTIKRAIEDYVKENNIVEYEVIKLYESYGKKALKEDYEEDYEEDEELTPVDVDSLDVDEFYNGYVMDNAALWDEDIDYDAMEANKNQIFHYWKHLVKGGEDEWNAVEISVRRFASNEELDEGCGKKKKKSLKESDEEDAEWKVVRQNAKANPSLYGGRYTDKDSRKAKKEWLKDKKEKSLKESADNFSQIDELIRQYKELGKLSSAKRPFTPEERKAFFAQYEKLKDKWDNVFPDLGVDLYTPDEIVIRATKMKDKIKASSGSDTNDEIKKILNKYNQEYNFLYNNHDKVAGYEEAVRAWDEYINHPDFRELIGKVIKARHDMFTSDREIGALMFALDALGYLDKFDGKESSLEPIVKEFKA